MWNIRGGHWLCDATTLRGVPGHYASVWVTAYDEFPDGRRDRANPYVCVTSNIHAVGQGIGRAQP